MARDDAWVERYSRQLILAEVGPRGQERLAAARVAVAARGAAAERVVAYLAAAGVGTLAVAPELRAVVDPDQPDVRVETLATAAPEPGAAPRAGVHAPSAARADFDAALVEATQPGAAAAQAERRATDAAAAPRARREFWIADGRAAETPPCRDCAAAALGAAAPAPGALASLREALLGTVVATEIVKAILAIGTPLGGSVLAYDPETASLTTTAVASRPGCPRCDSAVARG